MIRHFRRDDIAPDEPTTKTADPSVATTKAARHASDRRAAQPPPRALAGASSPSCWPTSGLRVTQATLSRDLVELDAVARPGRSRRARLRRTGRGRRPDAAAGDGRRQPSTAGSPGSRRSCSSAPRPRPTWWCSEPRRAPRSSWPRRSTTAELDCRARHHRRRRHGARHQPRRPRWRRARRPAARAGRRAAPRRPGPAKSMHHANNRSTSMSTDHSDQRSKRPDRPRLLRRSRHLRGHRLARRADRRGGRRRRHRRRPGRRGPGDDPQARARLRRRRGRGGRRQGRVRRASTACPALQANALYMDRYPLVSALSRPLIVKHLVKAAARARRARPSATAAPARATTRSGSRSASARSHRDLKVIAPVRDYAWTREKAIAYAEDNGLPDRRDQEVAVLHRPERLGPRRRDRLPRGHLERARSRTSTPTPPTRPRRASPTRSSITFDGGVPVAIDGRARHRAPGDPAAQRAGRRAGRRPARRGRGPARRHQEPRGLRSARRDRADHRAPGAGERHGRARPGAVQADRRPAVGRARLRRPVVLAAEARRSTRSSRRRRSTSPATSG